MAEILAVSGIEIPDQLLEFAASLGLMAIISSISTLSDLRILLPMPPEKRQANRKPAHTPKTKAIRFVQAKS